jgi:hypothetical protein
VRPLRGKTGLPSVAGLHPYAKVANHQPDGEGARAGDHQDEEKVARPARYRQVLHVHAEQPGDKGGRKKQRGEQGKNVELPVDPGGYLGRNLLLQQAGTVLNGRDILVDQLKPIPQPEAFRKPRR